MTHPVTVDIGDGKPVSQHRHDLGVGDLAKQMVNGGKESISLLSARPSMRENPSSEPFALHNAGVKPQPFPTLCIGHRPQEQHFLISEEGGQNLKPWAAEPRADLTDSFPTQTVLLGDVGIKHAANLFYEAGVAVLYSL